MTEEEKQAALWWYHTSNKTNKDTILKVYRMENNGKEVLS